MFPAGLHRLALGNALIPRHRRLLTGWMRSSVASGERMREDLPVGWVAADKSDRIPRTITRRSAGDHRWIPALVSFRPDRIRTAA